MKYRKKPVIIEAVQFFDDSDTLIKLSQLIGDNFPVEIDYNVPHNTVMYIPTLEGTMKANIGDFIIKSVNGEFYPCKPDIFEKTYEIVLEEI